MSTIRSFLFVPGDSARTQALFVRVNPFSSGLILDGMEAMAGLERGSTRILSVVIESAQAVLRMDGYAGCGGRLRGLLWGAEDLSASLGASSNAVGGTWRSFFRLARDLCLLAAAAAGVVAIDTVHTNVRDLNGLRREAEEARLVGIKAKVAIHPSQCSVINEAFQVTAEEVRWARTVLQALAEAPDRGVATLDGHMLDRPHEQRTVA